MCYLILNYYSLVVEYVFIDNRQEACRFECNNVILENKITIYCIINFCEQGWAVYVKKHV